MGASNKEFTELREAEEAKARNPLQNITARRSIKLEPFLKYVKDYGRLINLPESEFQKEFNDIKNKANIETEDVEVCDFLEENRESITYSEFAEKLNVLLEDVEDGATEALEAFKTISQMQKLIKIARDTVDQKAIKSASLYEKAELKELGYTVKQGSQRLDFKGLGYYEEAVKLVDIAKDKGKAIMKSVYDLDNKESEINSFLEFDKENETLKNQLKIVRKQKQLLAEEYEVDSFEELFDLCPEVSITKSSISFTPPKK